MLLQLIPCSASFPPKHSADALPYTLRGNKSKKWEHLFFLVAKYDNLPTPVPEMFDFLSVIVCVRPMSPVLWSCNFLRNFSAIFSFIGHHQFFPLAGFLSMGHKHVLLSPIWKHNLIFFSVSHSLQKPPNSPSPLLKRKTLLLYVTFSLYFILFLIFGERREERERVVKRRWCERETSLGCLL